MVSNNIITLTVDYFYYESQLKIFVNNNNEDYSYPRVTLNTMLNILPFKTDWKDYFARYFNISIYREYLSIKPLDCFTEIENKCDQLDKECYFIDYVTFLMNECYDIGAKELLDERVMKNIYANYNLRYNRDNNWFGIMDIDDKISGIKIFNNIESLLTLTLNRSKIISKKNDLIFQINNEINSNLAEFKSIILHSQPIPHLKEFNIMSFKKSHNYSLLVTKTKRSYLGPPYSQCSHYRSDTKTPFNALSHMQCYRHCLRTFAQNHNRLNCTPLFIDDIITELDLLTEENILCKFEEFLLFKELVIKDEISKLCIHLCPKDCLTVDYSYVIQRSDSEMDLYFETSNRSEVSIVWDSRQPMLSYIEESVLSFTDYLVNCGGLLGIWFGINANDFFVKLLKAKILFKFLLKLKIKSRTMGNYFLNSL